MIVLLLKGIALSAAGQAGCNPEALKKIQGVWLAPKSEGILNKPATADIAAAKKILDAIRQRFQEQYTPIGVDARHSYWFDDDSGIYQRYGNPYNYTLLNFRFYCLNGKKTTNAEGDGTHVYFNNEGTQEVPIYLDYGDFGVNSEVNTNGGFHVLKSYHCPDGKLPDVSKGYHIFGDENNYYVWFIYNGKLPFRYVTRKEFLEKQVAILEAQVKEFGKKLLSPEMKALLDASPAYKEQMMESLKLYRKPLEGYQSDLKKDVVWLKEMAIVDFRVFENWARYVFTTLADQQNMYMFIPIMPNPDYYDRKLPIWAPQHISIHLTGNGKNEYVRNQRKLIDDNITFFKSIIANRGLLE